MDFKLSISPRLRGTPFSARVETAGVKAYTVYNHMLLPTVFRSVEADYQHLKEAVQIWDVSVERQVEIKGPDAEKLVQMSTPRDLSRMQEDQCFYIPTVDAQGFMTNDPVLNRIGKNQFWVSIASSDLILYYKGLAAGFKLDVEVSEPDIHPLALQGPKSFELVERLFGAEVAGLRFFRHTWVEFAGRKMLIARSGWSSQGGFEIYLDGAENGEALWDWIVETGRDLDIYAGGPNAIERIEGGLLSFGNDMSNVHTPFECGLSKCVQAGTDCLADQALQEMGPPQRHIRPIEIEGTIPALRYRWKVESEDGQFAGSIGSAANSPDFGCGVAIGMIEQPFWQEGTKLVVKTPTGDVNATVKDRFWI